MFGAKILLVGESLGPNSYFAQRLTNWGAECEFASSCQQACALVRQKTFEIVIGEMKLMDGLVRQIIPLLEGSRTSFFCSYPIEDSCLWVPVLERGQVCLGGSTLRPNEFGRALRQALTSKSHH
jgi:hypothetical protein